MNKRQNKPSEIRIAIIEDHVETRELLAEALSAGDEFECSALYGDVESAVIDLPEKAPEVLLLDVNLPGLSGIDGARLLKQKMPECQIIMLTVYEDSEHVFAALSAGATGYLLKETPVSEILAAVREVRAGGSPMSSHIARKVVQYFQSRAAAGEPDSSLSSRELEVLQLLARGFLYKEIAESMSLSLHTVATYVRRIYEKLHVRTRTEAVSWYLGSRRDGRDR